MKARKINNNDGYDDDSTVMIKNQYHFDYNNNGWKYFSFINLTFFNAFHFQFSTIWQAKYDNKNDNDHDDDTTVHVVIILNIVIITSTTTVGG